MSLTASKYINNSELKTSYIGLFHYDRKNRGKKDIGVDIYGVLSVSSEVEIPGDKISKFAWDVIVDAFEYSKLDSVNESLKLSLTEATRRIKQLITNDSNIAQHGVDINFTIFVSNNGGIYIGLLGDSDIYVFKKGRLVDIFDMLNSKRAKTAGVAIEEGDIVFASTKGFLKENINRVMNTKDRSELISVLEELGREIGDDQGLVVFSKDKVKEEEIILEETKEEEIVKPLVTEPTNSDYISTSKTPKKIFKPLGEEKDLKDFLGSIVKKTDPIKSKILVPFKPIKNIFSKLISNILNTVKNIISKTKGYILELFNKKRWFKKISAKVSQSGIHRRKENEFKEFRIDGYKQRDTRFKRFKILFLVVLGISLIVGGIKFTMDQKEARDISRAANSIFTEVEKLVKDAESKLTVDRANSEVQIFQASKRLNELPEGLSEKDLLKYEQLEIQVLGIQDTLTKKVRLKTSDGSIERFIDTIPFAGQNSNPSDIGIYRDGNGNEYLLVTDIGIRSVYRISMYNKEDIKSLPNDDGVLESPQMIYTKPSGIFVLDLVNGVLKAEFSDGWFKTFKRLSGLSIQNIGAKDIAEFAVLTTNENIYILDREQKALLKSSNFGTGYGLSFPYVTSDSFVNANDILSDFSVYILTSGEDGIHRYVSGEGGLVESTLTIGDLDTPLKNPRYGYTADDQNKDLYVFDSEDRRILKFEKPLESGEIRHPNQLLLQKQYVYPEESSDAWKNVKDFVVDYNEKYLYILDGTTIWKVKL